CHINDISFPAHTYAGVHQGEREICQDEYDVGDPATVQNVRNGRNDDNGKNNPGSDAGSNTHQLFTRSISHPAKHAATDQCGNPRSDNEAAESCETLCAVLNR